MWIRSAKAGREGLQGPTHRGLIPQQARVVERSPDDPQELVVDLASWGGSEEADHVPARFCSSLVSVRA
jgi:hypothetical protein